MPRRSRPFRTAATLLLVSSVLTARPALAQALQPVAQVEGITEYQLDNGLRVLLFPDPSAPQVTVNVTYFVGSRHEGYGETGMAHLLEHMVFKGTPNHPDIPQELTEHGAQPNGTTWYDRTNYFETFASTDENLEWALDLEADRMVHSFISAEDLESEMTVVRNEFEAGENSPLRVLLERTLSTAYLWHNYGQSTIGARSDIESVPVERLQAFYRKYYQPDNSMLIVAGSFDDARVLELVQEKFGAIPRPDRSDPAYRLYPTYTDEPDQDGERLVHLRRVGDTQMLMVSHHVAPGSHEDFAAIDVLEFVMSDNPSGRLYEALVESGKAASVGSVAFQLREPSPLLIYAEVRLEDDMDAAYEALIGTLGEFDERPVADEEVERAKTALHRQIELAFNDSRSIALQLSEWAGMGDWRLFFLHRDRIEAVTTQDVNRVARAYLLPSNRTVGFFHPTDEPVRASIPEPPDVAALVADYEGRAAVAEAEAFEPTPLNIESRASRERFGDTGFSAVFLPKQTRGDQVVARFRVLFGNEETLAGRRYAASMAAEMLMRGTTRHARQELQDELDRLKAEVDIDGGIATASGSIVTTRDNLVPVMELVREVLRGPAFDEAEFEQLREARLAGLEARRSEPQAIAGVELARHLSPYPEEHPYATPTLEADLEGLRRVSVDDARRFYEEFYGAVRGHMAIVGDFGPDTVRGVIESTFGDWTADTPSERNPSRYFEVEPIDRMIETPDKANAVLLGGLNLPVGEDHPDYPALVVGNFMLGGGFLSSRLATRVRQQEGLSYGVGSALSAHPIDGNGTFRVFAIYAPENVVRLQAVITEELERARSDGFTEEELQAALSGYLQSRMVSRGRDETLARQLSVHLYFGRTMVHDADLERRIGALSVDEVNAAFRRWIDPTKISFIKAGDFEAAGITNTVG